MTEGVHHIALLVRDLPAAERFYVDLLGLPVLKRWPTTDASTGAGDRSVWLDLGGGAFLALEKTEAKAPDAPAPEERPGWHLLALRIACGQRARWVACLSAAGFPVIHRTPYTIYVRDPEGNRVGLSHFPEPADSGDRP